MILWKQRLYAFLLRRILGPLLDTESLQKLHQSIDISLQEGSFALTDISLNVKDLKERLSLSQSTLRIRRVAIQRLVIHLTLHENTDDTASTPSSLAWRAFQLTTATTSTDNTEDDVSGTAAVSLLARVELDGVVVHVEPNPKPSPPPQAPQANLDAATPSETSAPKSRLSSYIDAALASLRLTLQLQNLQVRLIGNNHDLLSRAREEWIELRLQSASYRDVEFDLPARASEFQTVMYKTLDFHTLSVHVGETAVESEETSPVETKARDPSSSTIALLQGPSQISLRAFEYKDKTCSSSDKQLQQDIEVNIQQRLNLSVDKESLVRVLEIAQSFQPVSACSGEDATVEEQGMEAKAEENQPVDEEMDEADLDEIGGIMKQFQEARLFAERHELRGGILLPSSDVVEDGEVTFDAFFDANEIFDANDYSLYRYSVSMRQSILQTSAEKDGADFVHTKLRFHLKEGGIKVSFRTPSSGECVLSAAADMTATASRKYDEYVLLTFSDLNASSALSLVSSDHSMSVTHLDIEESRLDPTYSSPGVGKRIEIASVLRFCPMAPDEDHHVLEQSDILLQAPCISIHAKTEKRGDGGSSDIEVSLEPFEITYQQVTMANLADLLSTMPATDNSPIEADRDTESDGGQRFVCVRASCGSITVGFPVTREEDWSGLYDRCGYQTSGSVMSKSSLSFELDQIALELNTDDSVEETVSVSFHHILAFATSPSQRHALERKVQRFDLIAVSGLTEVDPVIPVSFNLYQRGRGGDKKGENPGRKFFPVVPALSSFKARQEDEDEDNRIDRVLHSKLQDVETDIRKGLRSNDPQSAMLSAASESDTVLTVNVPEIVLDLSAEELSILNKMMACLVNNSPQKMNTGSFDDNAPSSKHQVGVFFSCDYLSVALHESVSPPTKAVDSSRNTSSFSYMLKSDQLKAHVLADGRGLRNARLLAYEVDFLEIANLVDSMQSGESPLSTADRRDALRERTTSNESSSVVPIVHRSHLFAPISRESPSLLFDWIRVATENDDSEGLFTQRNVHLTLYDMTYRYDFDSGWIQRFYSMIRPRSKAGDEKEDASELSSPTKSLTRVFCSIADCNVDYSSSLIFETPSRTIVRVGDLRVSSNIVLPAIPAQAFTVSLGDTTVYLCPERFPYYFENTRLLRSASMMSSDDVSLNRLNLTADATAETVLRAMNYRTILMLDCMDAIVAISTSKSEKAEDPRVRISLTFGELGLFVCKDSLSRFAKTIGELQAQLTALDDAAMASLKAASMDSSESPDTFFDSRSEEQNPSDDTRIEDQVLEDLKRQSALRAAAGTTLRSDRAKDFLLDGYDWTTIETDESNACGIPSGEEQSARWYTTEPSTGSSAEHDDVMFLAGAGEFDLDDKKPSKRTAPRVIAHHFPLHPVSDPFGDGDMGAAKYAGTGASPQVQNRILIHDLCVKLRFFDGYDWPELLDADAREAAKKGAFVIDEDVLREVNVDVKAKATEHMVDNMHRKVNVEALERKAKLMGDLLDGTSVSESATTFRNIPLPEERGMILKEQAEVRRLARRTAKYFQVFASGIILRLDTYEPSEHRLVSCMNVALQDFFLAETISSNRPVKMLGEWVNEAEHPRETKDGLIMMKMVTWHPSDRVTLENEIANDECLAGVKILPLRCILDQKAIRFARTMFHVPDSDKDTGQALPKGLHAVPPPLFRSFSVRPLKMKIDYTPEKIDTRALRDGAFVELINLSPLDSLVLTLLPVQVDNVIGFGDVLGIVIRRWIEHVCATQLHKFLTNTLALEPITHIGGGAVDMIVLPWEALKNGESIRKALTSGVRSFAKALTYEALTTSSRVAHFVAEGAAKVTNLSPEGSSLLPSRPLDTPRTMLEATPHAVESIARGLQTANYKIIIIPYREYHRTGTKGAVKSVLKGIPVAIAAPASGAVEALSFALLGTRNQFQPDIRKEEEASNRGLQYDG